jgi:hypothetical protein
MRDSADSDDYGVTRRGKSGKNRGKFLADEASYVKRDRHRRRLAAEDANDGTDGLPAGDRWSTWDQTETPNPNDVLRIYSLPISCSTRRPDGIL